MGDGGHGSIHIGTSGWVYPHWKGIFYPADCPQRSWLEYYARHFDTTEINASFYRLPTRAAVEKWQRMAGANSRFCPKISRYITHAKKLNDPEQGVPRFFDVFDILGRQAGPVLIQLPAVLSFHEQKVRHFMQYLYSHYRRFRFSIEARRPDWTSSEAIALLKEYHLGWVIAESGARFASAELVIARHIYLRFHGPDGSYATSHSNKMLAACAAKCLQWRQVGHAVWVYFNNDLGGHAIHNAMTLKNMINKQSG